MTVSISEKINYTNAKILGEKLRKMNNFDQIIWQDKYKEYLTVCINNQLGKLELTEDQIIQLGTAIYEKEDGLSSIQFGESEFSDEIIELYTIFIK